MVATSVASSTRDLNKVRLMKRQKQLLDKINQMRAPWKMATTSHQRVISGHQQVLSPVVQRIRTPVPFRGVSPQMSVSDTQGVTKPVQLQATAPIHYTVAPPAAQCHTTSQWQKPANPTISHQVAVDWGSHWYISYYQE